MVAFRRRRRRFRRGRRRFGRRRFRRNRFKRRRIRRKPRYFFKRTTERRIHDILTQAVPTLFYTDIFQLSSLPNYTEFTNLFDQFRINMIKYSIIQNRNVNQTFYDSATTLVNYTALPTIVSIIDYDDSATTPNLNTLYQYQNQKVTSYGVPHKRIFSPSVLASAYETGIGTAYMPRFKQWIDTEDSSTIHFGIKWAATALDNSAISTTPFNALVRMTYYIQCKNVK